MPASPCHPFSVGQTLVVLRLPLGDNKGLSSFASHQNVFSSCTRCVKSSVTFHRARQSIASYEGD